MNKCKKCPGEQSVFVIWGSEMRLHCHRTPLFRHRWDSLNGVMTAGRNNMWHSLSQWTKQVSCWKWHAVWPVSCGGDERQLVYRTPLHKQLWELQRGPHHRTSHPAQFVCVTVSDAAQQTTAKNTTFATRDWEKIFLHSCSFCVALPIQSVIKVLVKDGNGVCCCPLLYEIHHHILVLWLWLLQHHSTTQPTQVSETWKLADDRAQTCAESQKVCRVKRKRR